MVAYLQEDDKLSAPALELAKPAALPLSHEAALKWFYKDPQGEIQGERGSPGPPSSPTQVNKLLQ